MTELENKCAKLIEDGEDFRKLGYCEYCSLDYEASNGDNCDVDECEQAFYSAFYKGALICPFCGGTKIKTGQGIAFFGAMFPTHENADKHRNDTNEHTCENCGAVAHVWKFKGIPDEGDDLSVTYEQITKKRGVQVRHVLRVETAERVVDWVK